MVPRFHLIVFHKLHQDPRGWEAKLPYSSHRLEEVAILADRVLVIEAGRLLADCPPSNLGRYLGRKSMLKLLLSDESLIGSAVETLASHGYTAERNGTGVWVQVVPLEKARPISLLSEAGISVKDFHIE